MQSVFIILILKSGKYHVSVEGKKRKNPNHKLKI